MEFNGERWGGTVAVLPTEEKEGKVLKNYV